MELLGEGHDGTSMSVKLQVRSRCAKLISFTVQSYSCVPPYRRQPC